MLHSIMGGIIVFCLIYADLYPFLAEYLLKYVLFFAPPAVASDAGGLSNSGTGERSASISENATKRPKPRRSRRMLWDSCFRRNCRLDDMACCPAVWVHAL